MTKVRSKIVKAMPRSLRETTMIKRASSEERAREKAAVKARLFAKTKLSQEGKKLLLGRSKAVTSSASEFEEEEGVEEITVYSESDGDYVSEVETIEDQEESYVGAQNPCPDWCKGRVALENFNPPDLPNRLQLEQVVSQEVIQELEAQIKEAWNAEKEEISKEDEGSIEDILSTLPAKYLQIQLEQSRRIVSLSMRKLEAGIVVSSPSKVDRSEQAGMYNWLESAQADEKEIRSRIDLIMGKIQQFNPCKGANK